MIEGRLMTGSDNRFILTFPDGAAREFTLDRKQAILGRSSACDIVLHDARVSRTHARLARDEQGWTITDLGSTNGLIVNGIAVTQARLSEQDIVQMGDSRLRYAPGAAEPAPATRLIETVQDLTVTLSQAVLPIEVNEADAPRLAVYTHDRTWELPVTQDYVHIGRDATNDITIPAPNVSRTHARIERRGDACLVRDLDSTNGTWLQGRRIDEHLLHNGDTLRIGDAQVVFKAGPEDMTLVEEIAPRAAGQRRPVVFVPGIMGSELWLGEERVWPDVLKFFSNPDLLRLPSKYQLEPRRVVRQLVIVPNLIELEQYDPLIEYLQEALGYTLGDDLLEFPYDWRLPLEESALRLAQAIDEWQVHPPITLIAHSMGCLVSRYYVEQLGGKRKVDRLLLMGGPHQGAPKALTSLLSGPGLLPFGLLGDQMRDLMGTFPASYYLLPAYPCVFDRSGQPLDLLDDVAWLPDPHRPLLNQARAFRAKLGARSSVPAVCIFGYDVKTITRIAVDRNQTGIWQKVDLSSEPQGDGDVPQYSTVLPGADVHPVRQHHGALYVDSDVKMRLQIELAWR